MAAHTPSPPPKSLRDAGAQGPNVVTSLILANLTDADFDHFHAAHISYSGSTGKGARKWNPDQVEPYIATFLCNLPAVLHALGWHRARLEMPTQPHASAFLRRDTAGALKRAEDAEAELVALKAERTTAKDLVRQWRSSADWMMGSTHPDEWQRGGSGYLRKCADELEATLPPSPAALKGEN